MLTSITDTTWWVKLRHGAYMHRAFVTACSDDRYQLVLTESDQGIAAGQFAVLYDNDKRVIASGVIEGE